MFEALQSFTESLPSFLQWFGIMLIAAVPLVESYFGSAIGVIIGLNPAVAVLCAIFGNMVSMVLFVNSAHRVRVKVTAGNTVKELTPRKAKLRERMERYGVPVVSLLGQALLPSQITSAAMVSFGADRKSVMLWQVISITIWGVLFGVLATLGLTALQQA